MRFKTSTIFISLFLVSLLIYGFVSLSSNDPYGDYGPGTDLSITTSNGNFSDTTAPANWPYPTVWNWNYSGITGVNGGTVGATFFKGRYVLNRWNSTACYFFLPTGTNGGPGGTATQTTYTGSIRDMTVAPDGSGNTFLYGGKASSTLYKLDSNAQTVTTHSLSGAQIRAIAYDPNRKGFWVANWDTDLKCYDTTGAIKDTYPGGVALNDKYGMAWDSTSSPDSAFLWVWHQQTTATSQISKVHLASKTVAATYIFPHPPSQWIAGGAEAYKSSVNNDFLLALNYQNFAVVAYKIGDVTPPLAVPEVLYYTFDETGGDSTKNYAIPGRGFLRPY